MELVDKKTGADVSGDVHQQRVSAEFRYPVYFCHHAFDPENETLAAVLAERAETAKMLVFVDDGVEKAWPKLRADVVEYARVHHLSLAEEPLVLPGGETVKDGWDHVHAALEPMIRYRLCRHSYVLAVGGGAFLDAVGFAASLLHRGVRLVRLPTTTLAQGDSGVGVKNGINWKGQKNLIGAFAPPYAVVNDFEFLKTLSSEYVADGIAEAFKVAIIKDVDFFKSLCQQAEALKAGEADAVAEAVRRSALLHLDHIRTAGDPFESGESRPLDFGHWAAHRLEVLSEYAVRHGQAVGVGIALDAHYACRKDLLDEEERDEILAGLRAAGLATWHSLLERRTGQGRLAILQGLDDFREHLGGRLAVTLPHGLGNRVEVRKMDDALVEECIDALRP